MSIKGLKESELRKYKKFRKELSESQKNKGTKSQEDRVYLKMRKKITKTFKLPKEHLKIKEEFYKTFEDSQHHRWYKIPIPDWTYVLNLK